jgi:cell wall-associated NlpC family hydrolase
MAAAVRQAVIFLYTTGPQAIAVNPGAGKAALYAQAYADSTIGPYGVLARREAVRQQREWALGDLQKEAKAAQRAASAASKALADQQIEVGRLRGELAAASNAPAATVAADHVSLAGQAGKELLSDSALQFTPKDPLPAPLPTTSVALTWAFSELGKQYVWGATGPDTFDCSGLTQFVWKAAGVSIPRVASDQDAWTIPVPLSQLLPGDLVFFGTTDIHHVGIYIGDGLMINAPHTGSVVQVASMWWSDLAGFGRVHFAGTPVPPHYTPSAAKPAPPAVLPASGPVPSQIAPPLGWKPGPGATAPIALDQTSGAAPSSDSTSTTTSSTTVAPAPGPDPAAAQTNAPAPALDPSTVATTAPTGSTSTTAPSTTAPSTAATSSPG